GELTGAPCNFASPAGPTHPKTSAAPAPPTSIMRELAPEEQSAMSRSLRPARQREGCPGPSRPPRRTFRPDYLSFAATYQCNLTCPHCCVPIEWTDRLDVAAALRFLEDAHAYGIHTLGFTGGEPFLYEEFLLRLCRRGAELGFRFDKIISNG